MKIFLGPLSGVAWAMALLPITLAQQVLYGQCGGIGYTGATTCVSGSCCQYTNDWYSQCIPSPCSGGTTGSPATTSTSAAPVGTATGSFTNPVIYGDYPDNDVFRGPDNAYYFSSSNFHYSPGAPILKSNDLVNWQVIGHSLPANDFSSRYDMANGQRKYLGGSWASTLRYRKSTGLWYWIGCIEFWDTYIYTAPSPAGPWTRHAVISGKCYYDCGLLIDDDDIMYVVYGGGTVSIAQLSSDGKTQVKTQQVLTSPSGTASVEGNRLYKRNGVYYILNDYPGGGSTLIWKSSSIWGPWTYKFLHQGVGSPVTGAGSPHQGSLIQTPDDRWYFMSFTWAYPAGRLPVLAPITWGSDGFPILGLVNSRWGVSYPNPLPLSPTPSWTGTDTFSGTSLNVNWEWNHNPDRNKFSVNNGLTLSTVTVTDDIYNARNTLTRRAIGPQPVATIVLDFSNMADGDRAGLAAWRHRTAYIGVVRSGTTYTLVVRHGCDLSESDWSTTSLGTTVATATLSKGKVWLRGSMDVRPNGAKTASFSYSLDGNSYTAIGGSYTLNSHWAFFPGYRWGIFNYATIALGGSVKVTSFNQS